MKQEEEIIQSWNINAASWIDIIERNGIESRQLITNAAIVNAVCNYKPASGLDVGCGEGWLAKELSENGVKMDGFDAVAGLIEKAKEKNDGKFLVATYEEVVTGKIKFSKLYEAIIINFALIGKESVEELLKTLPAYLTTNGILFIQTLHPYYRKTINDYTSGWKTGSWDGLGDSFTMPYDWYFRTMEDWLILLNDAGYKNISVSDNIHPLNGNYLSVIFECSI
jgi:2-polyprenyl-3-methyl-5-hydroxy-6-metoxy-1,4-benzoquinol methylase